MSLRGQEQNNGKSKETTAPQKTADFESQYPIADYAAPEPSDPKERERRRNKAKKYNNKKGGVDPYSDSTFQPSDWARGLPALPAMQSEAVIIGEVIDAKAYLSEDKETVYSEFTVNINDVLKNSSTSQLAINHVVNVERQGGRVRFPSGHINTIVIGGQGMPRVGRRYLLFLTSSDGQDFSIVLGYELSGGHVFLLDNAYPGDPIRDYQGVDETLFLSKVRGAITNSSQ
jgi:hypothetical protein